MTSTIAIGRLQLRFISGNENATIFELKIPPLAQLPWPFYLRDVDETVYVVSGVFTTTFGDRRHELRAGECLNIPAGTVHTYENYADHASKAVIVLTPGSIKESYFEEMAAEMNEVGGADLSKVKAIMLRHGLVPV
jgi:mannose-6-phosphate isomerase-like protein (cupin superfamily)